MVAPGQSTADGIAGAGLVVPGGDPGEMSQGNLSCCDRASMGA